MQVCETFSLAPSAAWRELYELNPWPRLPRMLELRAYAAAKAVVDRAKPDELPADAMVQFAAEIEADNFAEDHGLGRYRE